MFGFFLKGRSDMGHWRWQTDFLSGWKALVAYGVYLAYLWYRAPFFAGSGVYFYLQLLPCIFIVYITAEIFGETFRPAANEYFSTFPVNSKTVILKRYLRLWALLGALHIPLCLFAVKKINLGLDELAVQLPEYAGVAHITPWPMLVQCFIAIAFYIALALILLQILKNRYLPVILVVIYCFIEYGPLCSYLGKYAVFYGCSTAPDLYTLLPPNIIMLFLLTLVFLIKNCTYTARRA
jgi:hypothetical protein